MEIKYKRVIDLIPYANNSRTHSEEQIQQVANSITEFGFTNPILIDEHGGLIAGHGRCMAAKLLNIDEVPTIELSGLSESQKKAYIIADNKLALNSGWDENLLKLEIESLHDMDFNIDLLGFDLGELDDLGINFDEDNQDLDTDKADEVPELEDNPCIKLGDLIELGHNYQHRLLCGDSTSEDDVKRLMDGKKADMVFTDPPYGVSYTGGLQNGSSGLSGNKREMIKNDDIDLYYEAVVIANKFSNGVVFMFYADTVPFRLYQGVNDVKGEIVALLIWKKRGGYGALGASYKPNHEPCLVWKPKGAKINFIGDTGENRVWEIDKEGVNKIHPTQKPVAVPERAISNHNAPVVLDMFGGSGSTLIASENLSRKARLMELDEKYAQVIIQRYVDYTSNPMIKINGQEVDWEAYKEKMK